MWLHSPPIRLTLLLEKVSISDLIGPKVIRKLLYSPGATVPFPMPSAVTNAFGLGLHLVRTTVSPVWAVFIVTLPLPLSKVIPKRHPDRAKVAV